MTDDESVPTSVEDADVVEQVERTDVGVSLSVQLTRGTGTRDQDRIEGKVKARSIEDAREDMDEMREYVRDLARYSRAVQFGEPGDDV